MGVREFIVSFRKAFGEKPYLPIVIWYSNDPVASTPKTGGCIFKHFSQLLKGESVSLNADNIGCGGGKFYCGFSDMPEFIPDFVSKKEHYKESPGLVIDFIENIGVQRYDNLYLNFTRIDNINSFENVAGVLFLATPDELSGLFTWACYDRNEPDLISTLFGSGCSSVVTLTLNENSRNGYRSFLGFFDPSARPYVEKNILTFAIPMSRFKKMLETMPESCLFDTHAWAKVYDRINE